MSATERNLLVFFIVLTLGLAYLLQPILTPFLLGMVLAYLGDPLVDRLEKLRIGRTVGAVLVFVAISVFVIGVLLIVVPKLIREIGGLIRDIPHFIEWLQLTTSPTLVELFGIDPFDISLASLKENLSTSWQKTGDLLGPLIARITASGFALMGTVMSAALTPVVAFYLMRDWDEVVAKVHALIPPEYEPMVVKLVSECDEVLGAFLRGQLLVMIFLGIVYSVGLAAIGLIQHRSHWHSGLQDSRQRIKFSQNRYNRFTAAIAGNKSGGNTRDAFRYLKVLFLQHGLEQIRALGFLVP